MMHSNSARRITQPEAVPLKIPIVYAGPPFIPTEALRRKLNDEPRALFIESFGTDQIIEIIKSAGMGIVILHIVNGDECAQAVSLVQQLSELIVQQKTGIILITRNFHAHLSQTLNRYAFIDVVPTSIEAHELNKSIQLKINILSGKAPKKYQSAIIPETDTSRDNVSKLFVSVTERVQIQELCKECVDTKSIAVISSDDLMERVNVTFSQFDPDQFRLSSNSPEFKAFIKALQQKTGQADPIILISFGLRRSRIFFKTTAYQFINDSQWMLTVPAHIFEVQRRTQLRLITYPSHTIGVTFQGDLHKQRLTCDLYDISAGGLAFVGNEDLAVKFQKGAQLHQMKFALGNRSIFVSEAEVRHATPVTVNGQTHYYRVGVSFKIILARDTSFLGMYVFRESLDYINKIIS